ncbi:MAG: hypothetical protein NWQ16_12740 [Akkermansiaceae bacterium]|nr:hypothetical protein [Akkermansiaceae bacterium]
MKNVIKLAVSTIAATLLASCGDGGYETGFSPPTGDEKYSEIFPDQVSGTPADIQLLELDGKLYKGAVATYGTGVSVTALLCKDQDALDDYVKTTGVPKLENYNNRSSAKVNGVWRFRGNGSTGRIYGWQNGAWVFSIEATDDTLFDEAVSKFPYISKK